MEKMLVNIESINTFKEQIVEENNKLIDILTKMYDDSIKYDRMVSNKSGNLYKEVMLRELLKEKDKITNNNETIENIFSDVIKTYEAAVQDAKKSVGA